MVQPADLHCLPFQRNLFLMSIGLFVCSLSFLQARWDKRRTARALLQTLRF
jgi:hypothetical protein